MVFDSKLLSRPNPLSEEDAEEFALAFFLLGALVSKPSGAASEAPKTCAGVRDMRRRGRSRIEKDEDELEGLRWGVFGGTTGLCARTCLDWIWDAVGGYLLGDKEEAMELQERATVEGGMFSLSLVMEMPCFRLGKV